MTSEEMLQRINADTAIETACAAVDQYRAGTIGLGEALDLLGSAGLKAIKSSCMYQWDWLEERAA